MRSEAMDEFVERVRSESDILSVVASYVPLKRKGNRYWGCCPFHQEKTPSFSVVPDQGFFYCFGCHAGGNVFKFLSLIENVSYFEAIKLQAEKLNISLPQQEKTGQELAKEQRIADLRKIQEMARDFFHSCLTKTRYGIPAKAYFASRDIREDTIAAFQLGFAPDAYEKLHDAFVRRGISESLLLESGLVLKKQSGNGMYDRFRNRVMIPITDERGHVVGFGGRVLDEGLPKYLNSPETVLFNKRRLLFGLDRAHQAIRQEGYAIVVEGYMDAISVYAAGVHNVVASLGTAFTLDQCRKLLRYAPEIYFCYDSDDAGQKATLRALGIVRETGAQVKVLIVPDGKDPDEFVRKHGAAAFRALTKTALPLAEYQIQYVLQHTDYSTLEGKSSALNQVLPVLKESVNAVELNAYVARLTRTLGIDEGIIQSELRRYSGQPQDAAQLQKTPLRRAVRQVDNAVCRAGRIVIRQIWQDTGTLAHLTAMVPLEQFPNRLHGMILRFFAEKLQRGEAVQDALAINELGEEAAAELSRALVEDPGGQDLMTAYEDCVRVLRREYLKQLYDEHRLRADAMEREGQDTEALQELAESQRIQKEIKEMDDL